MNLKRKIKSLADSIDPWNEDAGRTWYRDGHNHLRTLAEAYGHSLETVCGITAVLSPGTKWEQNLMDAEAVLKHGEAAMVSTYTPNKDKAIRILHGERFEDVAGRRKNTGNKVRSFYDNLLRPDTSEAVTIDRWIVRALYGYDDGLQAKVFRSKAFYDEVADAFRVIAERRGMRPNELQAMVWLQVRPEDDSSYRQGRLSL